MEEIHQCVLETEDTSNLRFIDQNTDSITISIVKQKPFDARVELLGDRLKLSDSDKPRRVKPPENEEKQVQRAEINRLLAERDAKAIENAKRKTELLKLQAEHTAKISEEQEERYKQMAKSDKPRRVKLPENEEKQVQRVLEINRLLAERDAKAIEDAKRKAELLKLQAEHTAKISEEQEERYKQMAKLTRDQAEHKAKLLREEMELLREKTKLEEEYQAKAVNNKNECRICYEKIADCVILPCKHTITCKQCCDKLKVCPLCRGNIESRMVVFV
jgi:hypothetical protein